MAAEELKAGIEVEVEEEEEEVLVVVVVMVVEGPPTREAGIDEEL